MNRFQYILLIASLSTGLSALFAQPAYTGSNATGKLVLSGTVNLLQLAQQPQALALRLPSAETKPPMPPRFPSPVVKGLFSQALTAQLGMPGLAVSPAFSGTGFNGLTHLDQRNSNSGNQFSHEPANTGIAVAHNMVLEGVNSAVMVYSASGAKLLPQPVSTSQLFLLTPEILRTAIPNVYGQDPTDMRVFYDQGIDRWFILQESQDKAPGLNVYVNSSHLYLGVSQTGDPTGGYNIYKMDTTNAGHPNCPCLADYPQMGADQYGFYISTDEYDTAFHNFIDASLLAVSKASLAAGAATPTAFQFLLGNGDGYEFAIKPATTPPGASYFLGANGLEYFVSSVSMSVGNNLAIWAMTNTASLATASPNPALMKLIIPTLPYSFQDVARQRPGTLTYGSTLFPPGQLAFIDGGDNRIQSVSYAAGRLYVTLDTQVTDQNGHSVVGTAYLVLSPAYRGGALSVLPLRQGYLLVTNNNLLRSAIAVNAQGRGAIAFTLVGPDYYPSAAFVPIDTFSTGSTVQIAAAGTGPEDGFTGYPDNGFPSVGIARWGDSNAAVAAGDGSIWMGTEYIPNAPRTDFANWGTFLERYMP